MIRIDIPATSANLGSGFDSLGIALTMCNRVWMEEADELKITTTDKIKVPTDETNLIYWAAFVPDLRQNAAGSAYHSGKQHSDGAWPRQFFGVHRGRYFGREPHAWLADVAERPH